VTDVIRLEENVSKKTYEASCRCGNLKYFFSTELPPEKWPVRKCSCEYCERRPNHIHCADPKGTVEFKYADPNKLIRETHDTDADFLLCAECGGYMGAVMHSPRGNFAVLNIEHIHEQLNLPDPKTYDLGNEDMATKYERRFRNWMPVTGDA
jgi:hypothetical protein